jgi:hypothetical protein
VRDAGACHGRWRRTLAPYRSKTMTFALQPIIAIIAGILILIMPRILNYVVAIYLILIGLLGLFGGNLRI